MTDLVAGSENVKRILPLEYLLNQVRNHMAHRHPDVSAGNDLVAKRPFLSDADAVERTDDRIRKPVLFPGALSEIFAREFLESVSGKRRRTFVLIPLPARKGIGAFKNHTGAEHVDFLQMMVFFRPNRGIECRRDDPLVFRQQIVGELVEIGDSPDHGGGSENLIAFADQFPHQFFILDVTLDKMVIGVMVV